MKLFVKKSGLSIVLSIFLFFAATHLVWGWTNPTTNPPTGSGAVTASGGNVGIGTTNPAATLDVVNTLNGSPSLKISNTSTNNPYIQFQSGGFIQDLGGGSLRVRAGGPSYLVFDTNSAERVRVDASGNVGIGTTGPGQKLSVAGGAMSFTAGGLSNPVVGIGSVQAATLAELMGFYTYDTSSAYQGWVGGIGVGGEGGGWGSKTLRFQVPDGSGNVVNALNILGGSGSVGIGTTAPSAKLHVSGGAIYNDGTGAGITTAGNLRSTGLEVDGYGAGSGVLKLQGNPGDPNYYTIFSQSYGTNGLTITAHNYGVSDTILNLYAGNVGIGTTNPGAALEVNGNIIASVPTASNQVATKGYVDGLAGVKYVGLTTTTYTGNLGGIIGANDKCNSFSAGSHMCAFDEILKSGQHTSLSATGWMQNPDGYTCAVSGSLANCNGWTTNSGADFGNVYLATSAYLSIDGCDMQHGIHCCK
ncbi:MAG: hypothetical protein M1155_00930 [Patescibacteria group bacterium]|nr:hypothetical protein [Patescibacteria group bacterium]